MHILCHFCNLPGCDASMATDSLLYTYVVFAIVIDFVDRCVDFVDLRFVNP